MLVSVIIPAYNAGSSIERAVNSVLHQTIDDFEIVIVDDGSTDDTANVVGRLMQAEPRLQFLPSIGNQGVSAARNRGLDAAQGSWIAFLDADDAFLPDRLEILIAAAASGIDIVADNISYFDWEANRSTGTAIQSRHAGSSRCINLATYLDNCITGTSPFDFGQLKLVVRREFLSATNVRYLEHVRHGEDFVFCAHLLLRGARMSLLPTAHYLYTERIGSVSRSRSEMTRTVENCWQLRDETVQLLEHPAVRDNPLLKALLRRRLKAIAWHQSWERVYYLVKHRRLKGIAMEMVQDWRIPILLVRKSATHFRIKLKQHDAKI